MKALRCKRIAAMLATTAFWSEAPEGMKRVWGIGEGRLFRLPATAVNLNSEDPTEEGRG